MSSESTNEPSCIEFNFKQLQKATNNFSDKCRLGEGGFGPVYKGNLLYTTVAIKQLRKVRDFRKGFIISQYNAIGKWQLEY